MDGLRPQELVHRGMPALAVVVIFVTAIAPFGELIGELYVLMPFHKATTASATKTGRRVGCTIRR
jgi:hypothetical protein